MFFDSVADFDGYDNKIYIGYNLQCIQIIAIRH